LTNTLRITERVDVTNPLARALEPPEKVLADALRTAWPTDSPGAMLLAEAQRDAIIEALHRAGYRIVPESPPACEHEWWDAPDDEMAWHCRKCGLTEYPGMQDELTPNIASGAVPESEVGLDVELLTEAMFNADTERRFAKRRDARDFARLVLAECARLSGPSR
jgi:hypothetical protein